MERAMTDQTPIRVRATHDLRGPSGPIRCNTLGEITGTSGSEPVSFTVTFWPLGPDGQAVTVSHLSRTDLRED
jgi:hypothetical protein